MKPRLTHRWDLTIEEAASLQIELARLVVGEDRFDREVTLVAGVDVAYATEGKQVFAAVVVFEAGSLNVVETQTAVGEAAFPYVPGLFSFREIPVIVEALAKLGREPELIVCDGQGVAHPRRFGLASHLGVLFDVPTIGCA
jgi:deoxyribonuclease V